MTDPEIPLSGGHMTKVVRLGGTVRRDTGPWTPAVHSLLRHLEHVGFDGTPRLLGTDHEGREILTYIDGDAGFFSADRVVPTDLWSNRTLIGAAAMLRRYHDATVGLVLPAGVQWHRVESSSSPGEVICHNDFAPYNCIFRNGDLVGVIDFDSAAPGSRLWDLAYAAYTFVPLYCDDNCRAVGLVEPPNRGHRLRLFCDSYGLGERTGFVQTIEERVRAVGAIIRTQAKVGDIRFQRMVDEGHADRYDDNAAYLHQLREELQRALQSASGKTLIDS